MNVRFRIIEQDDKKAEDAGDHMQFHRVGEDFACVVIEFASTR